MIQDVEIILRRERIIRKIPLCKLVNIKPVITSEQIVYYIEIMPVIKIDKQPSGQIKILVQIHGRTSVHLETGKVITSVFHNKF